MVRDCIAQYCQETAADLDAIDDSGRRALADASRLIEQLRRPDFSYQAELYWWTAHSDSDEGGGVPASPVTVRAEAGCRLRCRARRRVHERRRNLAQ